MMINVVDGVCNIFLNVWPLAHLAIAKSSCLYNLMWIEESLLTKVSINF